MSTHKDIVLDEDVFEFGRRNVFTSADDCVIGAAGDEQIAFVIKRCNVFRGKPALIVQHRPDTGVLTGDLFSPHEKLTGLVGVEHLAVLVTNLHLDPGNRPTD